jgi:hypothetical protein
MGGILFGAGLPARKVLREGRIKAMRFAFRLAMILMAALGVVLPATANTILIGSVSFDPFDKLYTYSYVIDNSTGPTEVNEFDILISRGMYNFGLTPSAHTEPAGWNFVTAVSGSICNPPETECGTFWAWGTTLEVPVGDILGGFSFTTYAAPVPPGKEQNDYFVWSRTYNGPPGGGIVVYGPIVGPNVPEPSTLTLLSTALAILGLTLYRRIAT